MIESRVAFVFQEWEPVVKLEKVISDELIPEDHEKVGIKTSVHQLAPNIRINMLNSRLKKGWTLSRLSDLCSISNDELKSYENGSGFPDAEVLDKLQRILNVQLSPLL